MIHDIFHAIVHALEDSILIFPMLLISYLVIEYIENKTSDKFENSKLLNGKFSPLMASIMGSVPQCSFSVVMTDLFSKKKIALSTLIAIYLATSDEAVPILLSSGKIADLIILMISKFIIATLVGYLIMILTKIFTKPKLVLDTDNKAIHKDISNVEKENTHTKHMDESHPETHNHKEDEDEDEDHEAHHHLGCCGHHIESENGEEKIDILHIIFHSLKVFGFIVVVNIIMNILLHFIGVENISNFLNQASIFQPFIAGLVGLIPNCASSIVITELYIVGGLHFGAMLAGLCTNAGIAMVILFKQNKNFKQNIFILVGLYLISTILGMLISFIPLPL